MIISLREYIEKNPLSTIKIVHFDTKIHKFKMKNELEKTEFMLNQALKTPRSKKLVAVDRDDQIHGALSFVENSGKIEIKFLGSILKGCGRLLLSSLVDRAKRESIEKIDVLSSKEGSNLYTDYGFVRLGRKNSFLTLIL